MFRTLLATAAIVAASLSARPSHLGFTAHPDGRGAEGLDDIWRGALDRPDAGVIEIRVETAPTGLAHGFVFVSHDSLARSFGATVTGRVDGTSVHLTGPIDVGSASGSMIDLTMRAGHGSIRYLEKVASAR
jgi:hypothetical protein